LRTEVAPIIFDHKGTTTASMTFGSWTCGNENSTSRLRRHLVQALWGLISPGTETREEAKKVSTFNARSETLMTKPTFTNVFLRRRCIVPAEAFYEWVGPKGGRQPLSIERADGKLLSNGWTLQLLEVERCDGASDSDVHCCDNDAQQLDG
jgi:putative SOS response-associated peptidase YedK